MSLCEQTDEDMHHVLWSCPLYDDIRNEMLSGIEVLQVGPVYYADLVGTQANFRRFNRCLAALLRFGPYDLDVGGAMGGGGIVRGKEDASAESAEYRRLSAFFSVSSNTEMTVQLSLVINLVAEAAIHSVPLLYHFLPERRDGLDKLLC
ncbi:hypothetical protein EVAR_57942_1 [Eumeta japonica]|uniref:Retrovirus-related Pol polyprotein from type-1 retrotransposable element R1 4 n=1 Tax=Eumeta variegata TaxID=151549 RepID=A0A4C1ZSB1_EUMVA|nr:hypothetical protein EVAR_57942_1 [Eumeta japonica]